MVDKNKKKEIPFIPNHILTEASLAMVFIGIVFILAALFPRELGTLANPISTPEHILPEWYFLWMYELLKLLPKVLGITVPVIVFVLLFAVPWIDRSSQRRPSKRPVASLVFALIFVAAIILTFISL